MRKLIIILILVATLIGCGNLGNNIKTTPTTSPANEEVFTTDSWAYPSFIWEYEAGDKINKPKTECYSVNLHLYTLDCEDYQTQDIVYTSCYQFHGEFAFDSFVNGPCLATLGYDSRSAPWGCHSSMTYRIYYSKKVGFGEMYVGKKTFFWIFRSMETSRLFFNTLECTEALIWNIQIPEGWGVLGFTYVSSDENYHWE